MRICSLLPSATEIVFALGLGDDVVGVSHTCDFPHEATKLPVLTRSLRKPGGVSNAVPVHGVSQNGVAPLPSFALDSDLLGQVKPDLILTQDICEVCAIGSDTVFEVATRALSYSPEFVTVQAARLGDVLGSIRAVGTAADIEGRAEQFAADLTSRIDAVLARVAETQAPKRVLCIEWAKPLRAAGLWTSDSVELAGGVPGLTPPGERSRKIGWDEVADFSPDIVLFTPCGYDIPRSFQELATVAAEPQWASLPAVRAGEVYVFDGRVPSRHGPRAVDVLEAFAEIFHPSHFTPRWHGALYQRAA
jgi:iron complex transport system substrate-binding protein